MLSGLPKSAEELSEIKRYALDSPLLKRRLIFADARTTAVLAQMRIPSTLATIEEQARAIDAMKSKLAETPAPNGVRVRVTGAPSVEVQTTAALISDQLILTPKR